VTVRRAVRSDARQIAEVHVRAWRAAYRGLLPDEVLDGLSVEDRERSWRELLSDPDGRSFTLVAAGGEPGVEGFCAVAVPSRDHDADALTAEVAATYVAPGRWRTGIGSALLRTALEELRSGGWREVTLWVFAENDRARSFYAKFGFEADGAERRHKWSGRQIEMRLRAGLAR
jgi:GNAT superfamily N-acetyltransferase